MSLSGQLNRLEAVGLIRLAITHPEIEYLFRHQLLQEVAYASLLIADRRTLHRSIGEALERLYAGQVDEKAAALAHHFAMADERDKAIKYSRQAAQQAQSKYAYQEATHFLTAALSLLGEEQGERRLTLLEELADVYRLRNEHAQAIPLYQEALELWPGLSGADKIIKVRLQRKISETTFGTDYFSEVQQFEAAARTTLQEGMSLMAEAPPHAETVRLLICLSHESWRRRVSPDWEAAEQYARAAVEMAEPLAAPTELSAALDALAVVYTARGLFRERVQIALRRVALSRQPAFTNMRQRIHLLNETGIALIDVGEYAQAVPYLQEAESLASQTQAIGEVVYALQMQAIYAFRLDRWDEVAMEEKFRLLEQRHQHERLVPTCHHLALKACTHALRGELARANSLHDESLALMAKAVPIEQWPRPQQY